MVPFVTVAFRKGGNHGQIQCMRDTCHDQAALEHIVSVEVRHEMDEVVNVQS